jgi:hypothetical protein
MSSGTGGSAVVRRKPKSEDQLRRELAEELEPYRVILEPFVRGEITADEFETRYFPMYVGDPRLCSDEVFDIVDRFFTDVDAYVSDPELRRSSDDLGPEELRDLARAMLARAGIEMDGTNASGPDRA